MQPQVCILQTLPLKALKFCKSLIVTPSYFLVAGFFTMGLSCFGQIIGDYRSASTGDWKDISTWERWNGISWTTPSAAFPFVASATSSTKSTTTGTSHTISLPSGIAVGDLLLVFWSDANDDATAPITPLGWTQLYSQTNSNRNRKAWYKVADGTEGANLVVTAGAERSAHNAYRIEMGSYFGNPVAGSPSGNSGSNPNPPNFDSGFGATNTLWIAAVHATGDDNSPAPTAPTNYTNLVSGYTGGSGNDHARMLTARKESAITPENPGSFSLGSSVNFAANTIAIRGPLAAGEGVPNSASGAITILSGHTVTVTTTASADQCFINSGGQITVSAGQSLSIADGSGTDLTVNGALSVTGTFTNAGTTVFGSGGTYIHNLNGGTVPIATWDANSTCIITGVTNTNPGNTTQNFGHFTWNSPNHTGNRRFAPDAAFVIQGNLTVISTGTGALRFRINKANIVGGNFSQSGGILVNRQSGTHSLTVNSDFELSGGIFRKEGDATPGGVLNVAGDFSHIGGTIDGGNLLNIFFNGSTQNFSKMVAGGITGTVNFTINNGSNVNIGSSQLSGNAFTINAGGTLQTTITSLSSFGLLSLTGAAITNGNIITNFGSFVPTMGDMFNIISGASSYTGTPTVSSTSNTHSIDLTYLGGILSVGTIILPIELVAFDGKALENVIELSWKTISELNNDFMIVERSRDGIEFIPLGQVRGAGTTQQPQFYSFTDKNPLPGINYYRLKQVDYDGKYEYSTVISVQMDQVDDSMILFPNPTSELVTLNLTTSYKGNAKIFVFDSFGRQIKTNSISLSGDLFQQEIDLSFLLPGWYIVEVEAGNKKWQKKLIIK